MDFLQYQFDVNGIIFASVIGVLFLFQMLYYFIVYGRVAFYKDKKANPPQTITHENSPSVSVIICAKDEAYNLKQTLPFFLEQEYPDYEVIVVDMASQDDTQSILLRAKDIYPHLQIITMCHNINKFTDKKFPLSIAIKSAKNDIIIVSDSDAKPSSFQWIRQMANAFVDGKSIAIGYTATKTKGGFLSAFINYDNLNLAMNYLSLSMLGISFMGDGRNLAYSRELFFKKGAFIPYYNLAYGEDDIFINQVANGSNAAVNMNNEAINETTTIEQYYEWRLKKIRHYKSVKHFHFFDRIITSMMPVTTVLLYCAIAVSILFGFPWQYAAVVVLLKWVAQIIIYFQASLRLKTKKIAIFAPLFELLFIPINTIFKLQSLRRKKNKWKH